MPPMPTKWIGPTSPGSLVGCVHVLILCLPGLRPSRPSASVASGLPTTRPPGTSAARLAGCSTVSICAVRLSGSGMLSGIRSPRPHPPGRARWRSGDPGGRRKGIRIDGRPITDISATDRRTGAADHQLRLGHAARHIVKKRLHIGIDTVFGVKVAHPVCVFTARLMADADVGSMSIGKCAIAGGTTSTGCAPLTAADHQQIHRVIARLECSRARPFQNRAAHRIAGVMPSIPSGKSVGHVPQATASTRLANSWFTRPKHAVLFMDHPRAAQQSRRAMRRNRG